MFEWIVSFIAIFGLLYRWTDQSLGDYEEGLRNYDRAISLNKRCDRQ